MKKTILSCIGLGFFVVASTVVNAQEKQETQQQIQMVQNEITVEEIKPKAKKQILNLNEKVDLNLTDSQVEKLSTEMSIFMVGQYKSNTDEELKNVAMNYQKQVNDILKQEQKEKIAEYNQLD